MTFILFVLVGGISTTASLILVKILPFSAFYAAMVAYWCGWLLSLGLNTKYTFSSLLNFKNVIKFFVLHVGLSCFVSFGCYFLGFVGLDRGLAYLLLVTISFLASFIIQKNFIFTNLG